MTHDDATPAFVAIPHMHPDAAPEALGSLPLQVRFFDPGLAPRNMGDTYYRPEFLPFDTQAARGALRSMQEFGESFGKPGQLVAVTARGLEEYYGGAQQPGPEMAELAQFVRSQGAMPDPEAAADDPAVLERAMAQSCQLTLLLAWAAEQRYLEIAEAAGRVDLLQQRLDAALDRGGDEDEDEESAGLPFSVAGIPGVLKVDALGWELAAEKMAFFLPPTTAFFAWDPRIAGELAERGLEPEPIADAPVQGLLEYAAPCWQLTGRSRIPEDMAWLADVRRLVLWNVSYR
ncbi:MAG: hypothetical protein ACOCWR_03990 [Oceanidesulfovibrio sp.]